MSKITLADKIRKGLERRNMNFKTLTAMTLFGVICLVFVFFNDYGARLGDGLGTVATVNNRFITAADLDEEVARLERSYSGFLGNNIGEMQRQFLRQQGLEFLVQSELMSQYAEKNGIFASDQEIRQIIMNELPYFQENGQFRRDRYEAILNANRMTPSGFEEKLRKDRKIQHLREAFELSSSILEVEKKKNQELEATQVQYQFIKLDRDAASEKLPVPQAEIEAQLKNPEFQKKVLEYFQANSKSLDQAEEVRAAHILIKVDKNVPGSDEKAKTKIQEIAKRAEKEDFGKLAGEFSEDLGSKTKKGDLGFFTRGRMVPEFENAAFALSAGKVSEPIKSDFGYHLIKVMERKEPRNATFEQFQAKITKQLLAEQRFETLVKELEEALKANQSAQVEASLQKLGQSWQETPSVPLGSEAVPGLDSPEALRAATDLTPARRESHLVRDGGQKWLIRLKAVTQKPAGDSDKLNPARDRANDRLGRWVEQLRKVARIERNLPATQLQ